MPARHTPLLIGTLLAIVALCGCSTTSQTTTPALTETADLAGADAGYTLVLPEIVSVLPEASGVAATGVQAAALAAQPSGETAFASAAPSATTPAPAVAATTPTGLTTVKSAPVVAAAETSAMPGVQTISYAGPVPSYLDLVKPAAPGHGEIDQLIDKYAALYEVPVDLVRHVVNRESTFNPKAYNRGHWGLMQIKHATARGMGYDGPAKGLFDAETNLKYAVKYLRGAWMVAGGNAKRADRLYQTGYYYDAKRLGLLDETGLGRDRLRRHRMVEPDA